MTKADSFQALKKLPTKLADQLMPFQKDGIRYALEKNGRCLIADEMGLGKTLQALSVAYLYQSEWPLLIIVPSSLRFCWVEEIEKWFPDTSPEDIFMVQTGNDASGIQEAKIVIATYGLLSKATSRVVLQALTNQKFQVVIVDESHYIRNIKTASCKAIGPLIRAANRRILLSGTPSLSKPVELFSQIDAICPNKFGSWWTYTAHFCDAKIQHFGKIRKRNVDGACNLEELQKKLRDVLMIRRMKDDVLTQLPAKQRQQILFQLKDSQVSKDIQKTFQELKSSMKRDRCQVDTVLQTVANEGCSSNTLSLIQRLYQLSGEAKIGPAREYVAMLCDNKNLKFLVFAYHRAMMNGLQQTLMEHDVKFVRIDGDTKPSDRQLYVQQFQSDPDTRVAILSILAAGVGLTFTKATLVVFAEMYWTPGVLIQCEDRAHRIGQTRCVSIHYLVAKDTMDEWVWSAICRKTIVTTTALNGQKQLMKADKGDKYQVELLSTADVYKAPSAEEAVNTDFAAIFSSQQPKDQPSILDFINSGKKRKREDNCSMKKRKRHLSSSQNSEDIVEIIDSDEEETTISKTGNNSLCAEKGRKPPNSVVDLMKKACKPKVKSKRLFFSKENGTQDEDDFVQHKKKFTKASSKAKKKDELSESWGCTGCTFLNHADLPFCEICNTPKQKKSKSLNSSCDEEKENISDFPDTLGNEKEDSNYDNKEKNLPDLLDPLGNEKKACSEEDNSVSQCNNDYFDNEGLSESQSSRVTESQDSLDSTWNDVLPGANSNRNSIWNSKDKDNLANQKSFEKESPVKSKRRRTFFLETYTPSSKSSIDEDNHLSQDSVRSDLDSAVSQTTGTPGRYGDEESEMKMTDSEGEVASSGELTEEDVSFSQLSPQPNNTQVDGTEGVLDDTGATEDLDEMFDDDFDQEPHPPNEESAASKEKIIVRDISNVPVFKSFHFKCSAYTSRIYLYDENGAPLRANFVPLDVELNNQGNLPDLLLHPHNLRLVQKFLREWNSLTETKRRLIVKSSQLFDSPLVAYEALKSGKNITTVRHKTKEDIAAESLAKANLVQGGVRVVKRSHHSESSLMQATTSDGIPICLNCSKPCDNELLDKETLKNSDSAWATRFCSQRCMDKYWIQTNSSYCRDQVYEAEHGVCQLCHLDAHSLYKQIRDTEDVQRRVDILHGSKFDKLNPKQKEAIVRNPVAGQFWHVDHIRPVWEGGGQCDIDNFRTLCVLCHQKVTAEQARKRATVRKLGAATGMADISAFFQPV